MTECSPIRFGIQNTLPNATLSCNVATVTPLDNLKSEWRSRVATWTNLSSDIEVSFDLNGQSVIDYVAIPGSNITGLSEVQIILYDDAAQTIVIYDTGDVTFSEPTALGIWQAGIDPYGGPLQVDRPDTYVHWLPDSIVARSGKIIFKASSLQTFSGTELWIRMLMAGRKLQMEKSFSYDAPITFLTPPDIITTSGGSNILSGSQKNSKRFAIDLDMMSDTDRSQLWRMESTLNGQPFIVSGYPNEVNWKFNNYTFLARFANALSFSHTHYSNHQTSMILVEV